MDLQASSITSIQSDNISNQNCIITDCITRNNWLDSDATTNDYTVDLSHIVENCKISQIISSLVDQLFNGLMTCDAFMEVLDKAIPINETIKELINAMCEHILSKESFMTIINKLYLDSSQNKVPVGIQEINKGWKPSPYWWGDVVYTTTTGNNTNISLKADNSYTNLKSDIGPVPYNELLSKAYG